jgi:hypothetical protein
MASILTSSSQGRGNPPTEQWRSPRPVLSPRFIVGAVLSFLLLAAGLFPVTQWLHPEPNRVEADDLPSGYGELAQQKSVGEWSARLLTESRTAPSAEGQRLYASAKAGFNGLIERLIEQLEHQSGRPALPNAAAEFRLQLEAAINRRVALTSYVRSLEPPGGGRPSSGAAENAGKLLNDLSDACAKITRQYLIASDEGRRAILDRLNELKWRPFAEAAGSRS